MTAQIVGAGALAIVAAAGVADSSVAMTGAAAAGMAIMQVWTLVQLQPIRDSIGEIRTKIAVLEQRFNDGEKQSRNSRRAG